MHPRMSSSIERKGLRRTFVLFSFLLTYASLQPQREAPPRKLRRGKRTSELLRGDVERKERQRQTALRSPGDGRMGKEAQKEKLPLQVISRKAVEPFGLLSMPYSFSNRTYT